MKSDIVYFSNVLYYINYEALFLISLKVNNISKSTISNGRTKNWNIILPAPIVDAFLIVYFFSNSINDFTRTPNCTLSLLFFMHLLNNRFKERFELAIVSIRHNQITNSIKALEPQVLSLKIEISHIMMTLALHNILFNTSSCSDNAINHLMLAKVPDIFSHAT